MQLQLMILPLLITFVKVDFEILMTGTRINVWELFNYTIILLLLSSCVLHHFLMNETSNLKNNNIFYQRYSDELHDPVPWLGLFCTQGE